MWQSGPLTSQRPTATAYLAEFVAQSDPTEDPEVLLVEEAYTTTGGTGRFAGASGSFTVERLFNLVTGFTSGSFDGFIVIERQ
jgi:hypothetical protein